MFDHKFFNFKGKTPKDTVTTKKISLIINDGVKIDGLKNDNNYNKLNPINISIKDSELNYIMLRYNRRYKYRVVITNLLFSSSVTQGTNIIFVSCNSLNDPRDALINRKLYKTLGIADINPKEELQKTKV